MSLGATLSLFNMKTKALWLYIAHLLTLPINMLNLVYLTHVEREL